MSQPVWLIELGSALPKLVSTFLYSVLILLFYCERFVKLVFFDQDFERFAAGGSLQGSVLSLERGLELLRPSLCCIAVLTCSTILQYSLSRGCLVPKVQLVIIGFRELQGTIIA